MFECEQGSSTLPAYTLNEAGKLRDELGYQRSMLHQCGGTLLALRVKAFLEFGIDLRCIEDPLPVQSASLN
ncbi:MAG: hypothetical protein U0796_20840 [Gemmatales bacterium]